MRLFNKGNKKGNLGFREILITIVFGAILALIGILVFSKVDSSIDRSAFTASANTTYASVVSTTFSAFQLATVGLIVLAAVGILATLFAFGG